MTTCIYQFKITLRHSTPSIWRRFEVHSQHTFAELHDMLQTIMGWENQHDFRFLVEGVMLAPAAAVTKLQRQGAVYIEDATEVALSDVLRRSGDTLSYLYDEGDGWEHTLVLEVIRPVTAMPDYPRCLAGERACPPENSGGVREYGDLLAILRDPNHIEYHELREWVGADFKPAAFSANDVNEQLEALIDEWA